MAKKRTIRESESKIINLRDRSRKRRKKRRIVFQTVLLAVALFLVLMLTPWFNIKYTDIKGCKTVAPAQIMKASNISYGQNIFRINKSAAVKNIKKIPYVKDVKIRRHFPNIVKFSVTERTGVAAIKIGNVYMVTDKDGVILEKAKKTELPLVEGYGGKLSVGQHLSKTDSEFYGNFSRIYELLNENNLYGRVTSFKTNKAKSVTFVLDKTKNIIIGDDSNIEYKLKLLDSVINELPPGEKGTIDLSKEGQALYTPEE